VDSRTGKADADERLLTSAVEALRRVGVDTKLGRGLKGGARESWFKAIEAMNGVMLGSAARLESVLKERARQTAGGMAQAWVTAGSGAPQRAPRGP